MNQSNFSFWDIIKELTCWLLLILKTGTGYLISIIFLLHMIFFSFFFIISSSEPEYNSRNAGPMVSQPMQAEPSSGEDQCGLYLAPKSLLYSVFFKCAKMSKVNRYDFIMTGKVSSIRTNHRWNKVVHWNMLLGGWFLSTKVPIWYYI